MRYLFLALIALASQPAAAEVFYLKCMVGDGLDRSRPVNFSYDEFKDSMLVSKSLKLKGGKTVKLNAGYVHDGEKELGGFLAINVVKKNGEPLAFSRHDLVMQPDSLRTVTFLVHGLAEVSCLPQ